MRFIPTGLFILFVFGMGSVFGQEAGTVVMTEVMYNPASSESTEETQYLEIANTTSGSVSLLNWTIDDEDGDGPNTLPDVTLPPFGIAVICGGTAADFQGAWGTGFTVISLSDLGQTMFNLANSPSSTSEIIELRDNLGNLIDSLNYDDTSPWPSDPGGFSIYVNLPNNQITAPANNNGVNWANSSTGTNGAYSSVIFGIWDAVEEGSPGNINGDAALPINLSSFAAISGNNQVILKWVTESEIENVGFEIFRATDRSGGYTSIASYLSHPALKGQFNSNVRHVYKFKDQLVSNDITFWYKLVDVDVNRNRTFHGPVSATPHGVGGEVINRGEKSSDFNLYSNYPNPFNPNTAIRFDIPDLSSGSSRGSLFIYNSLGQRVKVLYNGIFSSGSYEVKWNGTNDSGRQLPGGIYYAVLKMDVFTKSIKMLLLK